MILVWLRNDLRLADNPALWHACEQKKPIILLFCHCDEQDQFHHESEIKRAFRKAHVSDLSHRVQQAGITWIEHKTPKYHDVAKILLSICLEQDVTAVYLNKSYLVNEQIRDREVKALLQSNEITIHEYDANYLMPPGSVRKDDGRMYHVFTPYKKQMLAVLYNQYQGPKPMPSIFVECKQRSAKRDPVTISEWIVGERHAHQLLKRFVQDNHYAAERDRPDLNSTSRLSPYLSIGVLSARHCLAHALKHQGEGAFESTWVSELIWRDFYADLCFEYPHLVKHQTFKPSAVDEWQNNEAWFEQWQAGQTGFPIIDAGMRQLKKTGWMHNRVRMLTASFLTKLCLIDWRWGERHFMEHLIDGDFASNNGGWQWSSATGCDAAPYFRIFNPTLQSKKFDPDGTYIKKYVPELRSLNSKDIHEPSISQRSHCHYPEPIIDYRTQRLLSLDWLKK